MNKHWVVIPAAGIGARMQMDKPKQYLSLVDKTVLEHTIDCFIQHEQIAGIVVVIAAADEYWQQLSYAQDEYKQQIIVAPGGTERYASVMNGLQALAHIADDNDWVLIHDAARPCLRGSDISLLIDALEDNAYGGILAVPVRDTMKRSNDTQQIQQTIERNNLWHALTPQMFRYQKILQALKQCDQQDIIVTDEAMAMEQCQMPVALVRGHYDNIKITEPDDLELAEIYLKKSVKS